MKKIIIVIVALVIVSLTASAYFLWFAEKNCFKLTLADIESITIQSGVTGEFSKFDSKVDIEWFVSRLNQLKYKTVVRRFDSANSGWTYRILVSTKDGTLDYIIGEGFVDEGKRIYKITKDSSILMIEILDRYSEIESK